MRNLAKKIQNFTETHPKSTSYQWNPRILVVEDERNIAQSYADILTPKTEGNVIPIRSSRSAANTSPAETSTWPPFKLTVVHDAESALAVVKDAYRKKQPFAMGFFDVLLGGGKDGFELVKSIYEIDPQLFAVFVTAYNDRSVDSIQQFFGRENNSRWDYLNKPFTNGEILQKARNFTSLWNLQREKEEREMQVADLQQRLIESERLSAVAAVARGVNHEFGNILMQIMGKAELSVGKTPELMKDALGKIIDATQRASDILDRFKHLASGGHGNLNMSETSLHDLIQEAVTLLEHPLRTNNIKVCYVKMEKLNIPAFPTSLLQVFVNLIINSIHAMGNSGQIDFSVQKLGEWAEVRVRDYGPGIPPELLEKVKEPFFTTKGDMGTGLGLAICSDIIELDHIGKFELKNHGVKGLEVILRLPLKALDLGGENEPES